MGYTTDFTGCFKLNKKLDKKTHDFLNKLNTTRRVARNIKGYGVEGEFYVDGDGYMGQDRDATVIDYNRPPLTQPGLWQWAPTEDGKAIEWDGGEKFYEYVAWIKYIVENVLKPKGYSLTGSVEWIGEDRDDLGQIVIKKNSIKVLRGTVTYS